MYTNSAFKFAAIVGMAVLLVACKGPALVQHLPDTVIPQTFSATQNDTLNSVQMQWRSYFRDPDLLALIDTALHHNQELNSTLQEIEIARNEIRARKGEYLPSVNLGTGAGVEKAGRYTSKGASEATTEIEPGKAMPEPVPDLMLGAYATWEVDVWRKLRNAKDAAANRYLASVEGKHFLVTNLVAEIATNYYELVALDNQLDLVRKNSDIQSNALEIMRVEKEATRVTELAVKRFEAQLCRTKSLEFEIRQQITETENRLYFLTGRTTPTISRNASGFNTLVPDTVYVGLPSQLLLNRPDIRRAEYELTAAKLDLNVARACFYPSLRITAGVGLQSYNAAYLLRAPESVLYQLAGELMAPLANRNALKASYYNANSRQNQAVYNYERTVLVAYLEVANQLSGIRNLQQRYELKSREVDALNTSVVISNDLFAAARADYMEVLMTQRDVLEAKMDLIATKKEQMQAIVAIYRALGGGWN